jgi:hypothetical protein
MHLNQRPFRQPRRCPGAIQTALPNAACPRLLPKPLDAGIGQLLALYHPSVRQGNNQQNNNQTIQPPTLLAVLMAIALRRYNTACITQWRRSRASPEATGCHHWASTRSNSITGTCQRRFCSMRKRPQSTRISPNNNRGMTYQTDEKHLTSMREYFVGGASIVFNC